jgi:hypothetical protein
LPAPSFALDFIQLRTTKLSEEDLHRLDWVVSVSLSLEKWALIPIFQPLLPTLWVIRHNDLVMPDTLVILEE